MTWSDIPWNPSSRTVRQFAGLTIIVGAGLGAWQMIAYENLPAALWIASFTAAVGMFGLVKPMAIRPVFVAAIILTFPLGWIVTHFLLGCVFYGIFAPVGCCFRLSGRDVLARRRSCAKDTYWTAKVYSTDLRAYFQQF